MSQEQEAARIACRNRKPERSASASDNSPPTKRQRTAHRVEAPSSKSTCMIGGDQPANGSAQRTASKASAPPDFNTASADTTLDDAKSRAAEKKTTKTPPPADLLDCGNPTSTGGAPTSEKRPTRRCGATRIASATPSGNARGPPPVPPAVKDESALDECELGEADQGAQHSKSGSATPAPLPENQDHEPALLSDV